MLTRKWVGVPSPLHGKTFYFNSRTAAYKPDESGLPVLQVKTRSRL